MPDMSHLIRAAAPVRAVFGKDHMAAMPKFEAPMNYELEALAELANKSRYIYAHYSDADIQEHIAEFNRMNAELKEIEHPTAPIILWPEGKIPCLADYTDNSDYLFKQNPDYVPHMYPVLCPEDVTPKGAVILCPGGDHGESTVNTYQVALDFNAMGYQCFLLLNRPNRQPWASQDAGADSARAVRYVRKHAAEYRIKENNIVFAGFSNGGLTGEALIEFYSGEQKVSTYYEGYEPDELDEVNATPDAFICVYGPRFNGDSFKWEGVVYPPTFYAVGRKDGAMNNLHWVYPDLLAHNVPVEVHTFAGTPHGQAGAKVFHNGHVDYPNFELWQTLADSFLTDLFGVK